jgi:hypothetical protein
VKGYSELETLISGLVEEGLKGIEVYYPGVRRMVLYQTLAADMVSDDRGNRLPWDRKKRTGHWGG